MNWDDYRFVLAVAQTGSLKKAAALLSVEHTTVGRRVDAAEEALGVRLFTRTSTGLVATADADRLLPSMQRVEQAVLAVERSAFPERDRLEGRVRVTSPETFGVHYLAPRLARLAQEHPGLMIELLPAGEVLDLGRREAEVAVRMFRSTREDLVVRRVGRVAFGLYASHAYLARRPLKAREALADHTILGVAGSADVEARWLAKLDPRAKPAFSSPLSLALHAAARAGAGVAVLPRYLGDDDPQLQHIAMPDEPSEPVWLTVHRDLRKTPRVRAVLDFIAAALTRDRALLAGA